MRDSFTISSLRHNFSVRKEAIIFVMVVKLLLLAVSFIKSSRTHEFKFQFRQNQIRYDPLRRHMIKFLTFIKENQFLRFKNDL